MTPRRTCVGCRRTAEVSELVRLWRAPDGRLRVGAGPGRGAWVCAPPAASGCLEAGMARRALDRALRARVGVDDARAARATLEAMSG